MEKTVEEVTLDTTDEDDQTNMSDEGDESSEPDFENESMLEHELSNVALAAAAELPEAAIECLHRDHLMADDLLFRLSLGGLAPGTRVAWSIPEGADYLSFRCKSLPPPNHHFQVPSGEALVHVTIIGHPSLKTAVACQLEWIATQWIKTRWSAPLGEEPEDPDEFNIIKRLINYLYRRMRDLNAYCIICDEKQEFGEMAMPAVCQRDLCTFQYEELGFMADVATRAVQAEVLDLLLVFFRACVASGRCNLLLDPWPAVPDPSRPHTLAIDPKNKDVRVLNDALAGLPCPSVLFRRSEASSPIPGLSFRLFGWVSASNRTLLLSLPAEQRLSFLATDYQFIMLADSPAKEAAFREAKELNNGDTVFAFHGSPMSNWHSIMRKGLLAASNTQYQMHGAAYGPGIYLSPNTSVSLRYSQIQQSVPQSPGRAECEAPGHSCTEDGRFLGTSGGLICLAICEVVNSPSLRRANADIWVEGKPEHVSTRFLIVFRSQDIARMGAVQLSQPHVAQSLATAMAFRARKLGL